jgi:asparagine synthase (glutamine-hydrolysing)
MLRRQLYRDFHETVLLVILRNYDRLSMAHGVEVRMPLLDWRLVIYAFSLPDTSLLGEGHSKLILRRAVQDLLPREIAERRDKLGFASPVSRWLQGPWYQWLCDQLASRDFLYSPAWQGQKLRDYAETRLSSGAWTWDTWSILWRYIHATLWLRTFTGTTEVVPTR